MGAAGPRLCLLHVNGRSWVLGRHSWPSLCPVFTPTPLPSYGHCTCCFNAGGQSLPACLIPAGPVALVVTTASHGTLVTLPCPLKLISPIPGRNHIRAKAWDLGLMASPQPEPWYCHWGRWSGHLEPKLVLVSGPNSSYHLARRSQECPILNARPVLL